MGSNNSKYTKEMRESLNNSLKSIVFYVKEVYNSNNNNYVLIKTLYRERK